MRIFHTLLSPQEPHIRFLSSCSIHTYRQTYRCKWMHFCTPLPILNTPYPKNSAMMTRNDFKWGFNMWYLHVWGAFPSSRWYLSKHLVHTSGEGPTHLKGTVKGQNMAYRQTYIGKIYMITGKTAYLSNLKCLNRQKHHFTYYFLCKFNMYLQALIFLP